MGGFPAKRNVVYGLLGPNGKLYIGQAKDFPNRMNVHLANARHQAKHVISRAIRKYGIENFKIFILAENAEKDLRDFYESLFIDLFGAHILAGGYNVTPGGEGNPVKTKEHIRKFRAACLIALRQQKGKPRTEAQKEVQRKATIAAAVVVRGSKWSLERRAKIQSTWRRKLGK